MLDSSRRSGMGCVVWGRTLDKKSQIHTFDKFFHPLLVDCASILHRCHFNITSTPLASHFDWRFDATRFY